MELHAVCEIVSFIWDFVPENDGQFYLPPQKSCQVNNPPGRKVYQRGAHIIWEVDGAKEKVSCSSACNDRTHPDVF